MGRLPFDPSRIPPRRAPEERPLTVSSLAGLIQRALENGLPRKVRVVGEVSNLRERTHAYFVLRDAEAVVNCVIFASTLRHLRVRPSDGDEVVLEGRVDFYPPHGRVSLVVSRVSPVGAGALDEAFRRLCAELRELGWFDEARKRPLPLPPRRVALITSRTGAALQDVLDTLRGRCPSIEVLLLDVLVQGERAAPDIVRALRWVALRQADLGIDALLLVRGGGSMEDLWAFNDRRVARAILDCPVPVVAGIGHETDTTIAELVADVRAATPTQAGVRVAPDRAALLEQIRGQRSRLDRLAARRLEAARAGEGAVRRSLLHHLRSLADRERVRLERLGGRLSSLSPERRLAIRRERARALAGRLESAVRHHLGAREITRPWAELERAVGGRIRREGERVASRAGRLEGISPVRVLARGYSVTIGPDGKAVRRAGTLREGDALISLLASGRVESRVTRTEPPTERDGQGVTRPPEP